MSAVTTLTAPERPNFFQGVVQQVPLEIVLAEFENPKDKRFIEQLSGHNNYAILLKYAHEGVMTASNRDDLTKYRLLARYAIGEIYSGNTNPKMGISTAGHLLKGNRSIPVHQHPIGINAGNVDRGINPSTFVNMHYSEGADNRSEHSSD